MAQTAPRRWKILAAVAAVAFASPAQANDPPQQALDCMIQEISKANAWHLSDSPEAIASNALLKWCPLEMGRYGAYLADKYGFSFAEGVQKAKEILIYAVAEGIRQARKR